MSTLSTVVAVIAALGRSLETGRSTLLLDARDNVFATLNDFGTETDLEFVLSCNGVFSVFVALFATTTGAFDKLVEEKDVD